MFGGEQSVAINQNEKQHNLNDNQVFWTLLTVDGNEYGDKLKANNRPCRRKQ